MKWPLVNNLRNNYRRVTEVIIPKPGKKLRLSGKAREFALNDFPVFNIEMGKQPLCLHPYPPLTDSMPSPACDYILFDPDRMKAGITHFLRLRPGDTLNINSKIPFQQHAFSFPREAFRRNFSVRHTGDRLIMKDPISELGTYVSYGGQADTGRGVLLRRRNALRQVLEIFGGPLHALPPDEALTTLLQVNSLFRDTPYRRRDSLGNPGSVLELPGYITPVLVGDLHARIDNLLKILTENSYLEDLVNGRAALVILGDAVHPETDGDLDTMESSLLMMDLIFRLMLRFPRQVFYVVGNHDSFSHEIMKQGVPQGLLWEKHVAAARGEEYKSQLELFYQQSPLVVVSPDFIAAHAGPPRRKITLQTLVDARQFPDIVHDLTWNRIRTTAFPAGYTRADVRRFRKGLEADGDTPFIVGHHPYSREGTVWLNVAQIQQHHILISARSNEIGVISRIDDEMVPQIYPPEPLDSWLNSQHGNL